MVDTKAVNNGVVGEEVNAVTTAVPDGDVTRLTVHRALDEWSGDVILPPSKELQHNYPVHDKNYNLNLHYTSFVNHIL